jgi:hypothetical protein
MAARSKREAIEEAVQRLTEEDEFLDSAVPYLYARTVRAAFEQIRSFREKGVSFIRICRSFALSGLLPKNASPHSFRSAYYREAARREKLGLDAQADSKPAADGATKTASAKPVLKTTMTPRNTAADGANGAAGTRAAETEEEKAARIKELSGTVVETPGGSVLKLSNGSFDF